MVITFPLVGNYGVPSREARDKLLGDLPAYFEAAQIHIAGLVVATYAGEEYSHYLATSSLGTWLKEQGVPAICGVDTRALTKRIREEGSMLGKLLIQKSPSLLAKVANVIADGHSESESFTQGSDAASQKSQFEDIDWVNPNEKNLVAEGQDRLNVVASTPYLQSHSVHK